jgi:hypothetical protein
VVEDTVDGRRGPGTVNHCAHGKDLSLKEVIDWVPPEYETKRITTVGKETPPITTTSAHTDELGLLATGYSQIRKQQVLGSNPSVGSTFPA